MKSSDAEMKERKSLAGSTGTVTYNTYAGRAAADIGLEAQGRHAAAAKATVTGSARVPLYPAASGPWNDPVQVPPEPSLGYEINAQEAVGEPFEIAASVLAFPPDAEVSSMPATIDDLASPAFVPCVGEANSNVIVGSPSDNPTNAEVGGEAGRGDVGPGVHGDACTGTTSPLLRRGRKL